MLDRTCATCPDRQENYCGCYDTYLDLRAGGWEPCYPCGTETDMD